MDFLELIKEHKMEKCTNCGLESKYLQGLRADLCIDCYKLFENTYMSQNIVEDKEVDDGKNNNV